MTTQMLFKLDRFLVCIWALSILFALKAIYFCFNVPPGMPPDEMYHLQVIKLYSESKRLFPFNDSWTTFSQPLPEFHVFRGTTEYAYLYHLLFGTLVRVTGIDPFLWANLPWLRVLNLGLAAITLRYSFLIFTAVLPSKWLVLSGFVLITNLLMFNFLSAAVNYDNLLFVFCSAAIYESVNFLKTPEKKLFFKIIFFLSLASLTKLSGLIFAVFLLGALGVSSLKILKALKEMCVRKLIQQGFKGVGCVWIVMVAVLGLLNLELYLGNFIRYGTILPECYQVYSSEICSLNKLEQRANQASAIIKSKVLSGEVREMNIFSYFYFWVSEMVDTSIGVRAHYQMSLGPTKFLFSGILLLVAALGIAKWRQFDHIDWFFIFLVTGFMWFCFYFGHWLSYKQTFIALNGINGRYSYLILAPLLALSCRILGFLTPSYLQPKLALFSFVLFGGMQIAILLNPIFFAGIVAPQEELFYRECDYYPNPVYDKNFSIIENKFNAPSAYKLQYPNP
jgi:hypothetical protein